jgi:integrase
VSVPRPVSAIAPPTARGAAPQRNRSAPSRSLATLEVRSNARGATKRWHPPEGLEPTEINAIIEAATSDRDRLLLRVLWATGGRLSEVLPLRPIDVQRRGLVLHNRKNLSRPFKVVSLPAGHVDLVGELLVFAQSHNVGAREPIFASRVRGADGMPRPISKVQAWRIVKAASLRAGVLVDAMRDSTYGPAGQLAPVHPHLFRHARVRQILKHTGGNLPLAMHTAGWSSLQTTYLRLTDAAAAELMEGVPE